MNPRYKALEIVGKRSRHIINETKSAGPSENFGINVFNRSIMQKVLPKEVYLNVLNAIEGKEKIKPEFADTIAVAIKEWATAKGATHYSHWFQPLTGASAEKHDAFIDWHAPDQMIEKFDGKQLIQGEPDASSFPSGGLRSTYEARGYTGWDPTSPIFVWNGGDGVTLCIPSIFFSWTGDVLDQKIPLLRSDSKIHDATMRLLKLTGVSASYVNSTLGCEQEYFVVDRAWHNLRPDLMLAGRTVFGADSPKGQELQDHYFGAVKDRILCFMQDFENAAIKLAIPVKTRHNEVAPAQHEVAPIYERASQAVDHNILLMELMRQIAIKHDLSCLLHEKPFQGLNGSGKHCNWSLATDTGINLLNPTNTPENNLNFLVLITAILNAVYEHSTLLRASIGSAANDFRLGGHEAPPAVISVYLGEELEAVLQSIEEKGAHTRILKKNSYDLGIPVNLDFTKENTDRNRTSPFAFTGNKFEFRAVGSSSSPSFPMTVLNAIVAESLNSMVDEIEQEMSSGKKKLLESVLSVVRKYLKASRDIRFAGDNYSEEWFEEAKRRNLPNIKKSIESFEALKTEKTAQAFIGILTKQELQSRYEIMAEIYSHSVSIETKLMLDIARSQILPAAIQQQTNLASSLAAFSTVAGSSKKLKGQIAMLNSLSESIENLIEMLDKVSEEQRKAIAIDNFEKRGKAFCYKVLPECVKLREIIDHLETHINDALWPLPKYREILFIN
ncbi:MAG: glutamine synthetase III [Parachlamydiaceae bacterium]|nr:glutamine synthetase III [Parachlamydiaceae bacterium]